MNISNGKLSYVLLKSTSFFNDTNTFTFDLGFIVYVHQSYFQKVQQEKMSNELSVISAFVFFIYSGWVLMFSLLFSVSAVLMKFLINCNSMCKVIMNELTCNERSGNTSKAKTTSDNAGQKPATSTSTNTRGSAKRTNTWQLDTPPNKKASTSIMTDVKPVYVRNVHVIFRAFRYNDELMGVAIWNSFLWREEIDHLYGFPANAYLRIADILLPDHQPPFVEQVEGELYMNSNNASDINKQSLAHLLLSSHAERNRFRMHGQLTGFHYITKRGLQQVPLEKWVNANMFGTYNTLTDADLAQEMNTASVDCQNFLEHMCETTHNPATPGVFMNSPARYTFVRQSRNIPNGCMALFDGLLNTARGNVSRHVPPIENIAPVEVAVGNV